MTKLKHITIIGAGITGCYLAVLLAKRGYRVRIIERLTKDELLNTVAQRSINLTYYGFGIHAFKQIGLWRSVKSESIQLQGSITYVRKRKKPIAAQFDSEKIPYFTIARSKLLEVLLKKALSHPNISVFFNKQLVSIDRHNKHIEYKNCNTGAVTRRPYYLLCGTDGVHSLVRYYVQHSTQSQFSYVVEDWNYKQFILSAETAEKMSLDNSYMYAWTSSSVICTLFPNTNGTFSGMFILPTVSSHSHKNLNSEKDYSSMITYLIPQFEEIKNQITPQLYENPIGRFVTMKTKPWFYKDSIVILGDAAHAYVPFYGQGISAAFADAIELSNVLDKQNDVHSESLKKFQQVRKNNADIVGSLSLQSFIRYKRESRADYALIYEGLEELLHHYFPAIFVASAFQSISRNPNSASMHQKKLSRQRRLLRLLGLPFIVMVITISLYLVEFINGRKIYLQRLLHVLQNQYEIPINEPSEDITVPYRKR